MEEQTVNKPTKRRLTPEEKQDKEITSRGWGAIISLALVDRWLDMSESTVALMAAAILLSVNITRLVKGFRIHYLSLAVGLITLVHGVAWFLDQPFPFWYLIGGAVGLYGIAKLLLRERIR